MEDRRTRRFTRRGGATLLTVGLALGGFSVFAPIASADQPVDPGSQGQGQGGNPNVDPNGGGDGGNNGTVKVREAGTSEEDTSNDPQINCLEAAWFGFDETADVTKFDVTFINPTATATVQHFADLVTLQADAAGGSDDFDGSFQPAIVTTGIEPQNGKWHISVDIDTTTANGSTSKSKTVWISNDCGTENPEASQATVEVHKTVSGTAPQGTTFPFTVSCTTGTVTGGSFSLAGGGSSTASVSWDGETAPSCTVTETNTQGAASTAYVVDGGASTTGTAASTGMLEDGATSVVTFTNTYTPGGGGDCTVDCDTPNPPVVITPVVTPPAPVLIPAVVVAPTTTIPTQVEGVQVVNETPAPAPTSVLGTELARTGAMTDRLIVVAGLCLLLGGLALAASKDHTAVPARRR